MQADMEYRKNEKAVKYGLPYLDKLTRGIHRKELTTVAARPGVGKSSFALQVATRTAIKHEEKVLYFSLEMPAEQQMYRLLLMTEKATKEEIDDYYINPEAENFVKRIEQSKLLNIYESVNQLSEICGAIRSEKPYLVILDQLTQIRVGGRSWKSRLEELQEITATLKKVSMEENVAIMLLCQINRDAANSEPTLANLKGSGQIEEDSDNVILLHNLEKNDSIEPKALKKIQLKLEKQRSGATSSYTVMFNPKKYRFYELSND
jgi:replicative DNA helicase